MKYNFSKLSVFAIAASLLAGCKGGDSGSFKTDETTGVQYRMIKHDENGKKPAMGDFASVRLVLKTTKDSVLENSAKNGGDSTGAFMIPMRKEFKGCLQDGVAMMAIGDSAEFKISVDSLILKNTRNPNPKYPPFLKPGDFVIYDIKLMKIVSSQEMDAQRKEMMQKRMMEAMQRKSEEAPAIAKYLADKDYNKVKPTKDSLFFLIRKDAGGKAIKDGDSVYVKYTLMSLDDKVIETSDHGPGHDAFPVMYHHDMQGLIPGWVEALSTMHEGEKVRILVPSKLAYGMRGNQAIPPFTPLVFDLEVKKVVTPRS